MGQGCLSSTVVTRNQCLTRDTSGPWILIFLLDATEATIACLRAEHAICPFPFIGRWLKCQSAQLVSSLWLGSALYPLWDDLDRGHCLPSAVFGHLNHHLE